MTLLLIALFVLIGGVAVGIQSPISSFIGQRLGTVESIFTVQLSGTVLAGLLLLAKGGGNAAQIPRLPWYALLAGVFSLIVIAAINVAIPRIGVGATITLIVAGQVIIGLIADQFGWFGADVRPVDVTRVLGVGILLLGTWIVIRA